MSNDTTPEDNDTPNENTENTAAATEKSSKAPRGRSHAPSAAERAALRSFRTIEQTSRYQHMMRTITHNITRNFTVPRIDLAVPRSLAIPNIPRVTIPTPPVFTAATSKHFHMPPPPHLGITTTNLLDSTRIINGAGINAMADAARQATRIETLLPAIGLAQQQRVAAIADTLRIHHYGQYAPILPTMPDLSVVLGINDTLARIQQSIHGLLINWETLADIGHRLARAALLAARAARQAVLEGDTDAVREFAGYWLGFKKVDDPMVIDAVSAALLEPGWDTTTEVEDLRDHLRHRTRRNRNLLRPINETQLLGRHVAELDQPLRTAGDDDAPGTHLDLVRAPDTRLAERYTNPRLLEILAHFTELEIAIIEVHSDGGRTWAAAATECGQPGVFGEHVRRKLKRRTRNLNTNAS